MLRKFKNIWVLILCLAKFVGRGKADKPVGHPKKIIIMQMAKLGDMVCTTPMFRAVKKSYPNAKLLVIGNKTNKELLAGNKDVGEYLIYENNFWDLVRRIKAEKIDFACTTHPNFLGIAMFFLANVPLVSSPTIEGGYSPYETRSYKILRNFVVSKPHRMGSYAPGEYLRLLESVGIFTDETKKHLLFSKEAESRVNDFFYANKIAIVDFIIAISPSAGNKIKLWPAERFAELADYIYEKYGAKIIIIGGKNDKEETEEMLKKTKRSTEIINSVGLFNIDELKALISKVNLFISVDTGPVYIAESFDVPTIDIVGPMDENEQPPTGKRHRVVKLKNRKGPVIHIMNTGIFDEKEARRQTEQITVEMVIRELDDLMKEIKNKKYLDYHKNYQ